MKVINPIGKIAKFDRFYDLAAEGLTVNSFYGDTRFVQHLNTLESTNMTFFCIGDGIQNGFLLESVAVSTQDMNADSFYAMPSINLSRPRGFRYGLSGIRLRSPRTIFRRSSYGQFRDMLEMAPNTAYVDDKQNISFSVEAQFFTTDGSITHPENTACSNLSTHCTSSAPFFDRDVENYDDLLVVRNRGPVNNQVADITIEI